ncbi:ATP-dependent Clp protease adapter protein CLPS1, chloroplastic-like [Cucurbita pepo subsp. pepo]|uniref:ATP-dependent Clp protease adapter protein CLPS1, chloroplastic n=1 Tax=Cucurbita moschata TaxID=3662 RepID=A0A6J1GS56_CUCMO|nr:ATP-dependent Clp protease adapter protein CLPS1, chloroplastic [Cucurbita moschata]XP_023541586.1 ATP-dependent Clp protease adapter protein CLPS1, chloroplastic-like [Cucurbita pepo subsp. pepo]
MEAAICGRLPLSPYHFFNSTRPGDKYYFHKQCRNRSILTMLSVAELGKGGGLLEKPATEKTTPGRESEFNVRKSRKIAPPYRVLLHNDNHNKREYVVQVLMKVIPGMTVDNAVNIMQEAHYNGMAVVIICAQVDAEDHCMQLRGNGLLSSIEPASDGC